jgi:hypothetical protein
MFGNSKKRHARAMAAVAATAAAATALLSGCAATSSETTLSPTSQVVQVPGSSEPNIVLTPLGAERIGLETQPVTVDSSGQATFPYTALLYESNGQAAVYVESAQLTFTRHFVTVTTVVGNTVTVTSGVTPGDRVATDGSEELYGVQNGVQQQS